MSNNGSSPLVLWYNQLGMNDVDRVGGKNASLGEMITNLSGMGVSVPNGFATTADAFNQFLDQSGVNQRIYELLDKTDIDDVTQLAKAGAQSASGLSTLPSSLSWKTPSAKPMHSFPPMTKTPLLRYAPPPPQKTCRTLPLPVSRKPSSTFRVLTPFSWQ
ncbi:phosphoenolpyruvate synthase [Escherichia coli]|uniref:Phosphoenolpyruvate synthase n=1 Tax=Escherichia coli TaxID=562 RepID=A0A377BBF0_ECOLX|nr:phosphoenolpyruvate synthase [Escherichia coli]